MFQMTSKNWPFQWNATKSVWFLWYWDTHKGMFLFQWHRWFSWPSNIFTQPHDENCLLHICKFLEFFLVFWIITKTRVIQHSLTKYDPDCWMGENLLVKLCMKFNRTASFSNNKKTMYKIVWSICVTGVVHLNLLEPLGYPMVNSIGTYSTALQLKNIDFSFMHPRIH